MCRVEGGVDLLAQEAGRDRAFGGDRCRADGDRPGLPVLSGVDANLVVDNGVDGNGVYPNTGDGTCSGGIDKLITQHKLI